MSKLLITTQVLENYGTAEQPHWRAKGGNEYVIRGVDECDMIAVIVDRARAQIECDNEYFSEYILGWAVVADNYLTDFEQSQLDWEGRITYAARELTV